MLSEKYLVNVCMILKTAEKTEIGSMFLILIYPCLYLHVYVGLDKYN